MDAQWSLRDRDVKARRVPAPDGGRQAPTSRSAYFGKASTGVIYTRMYFDDEPSKLRRSGAEGHARGAPPHVGRAAHA
jgi:hypothetical protein